MSKKHKKKARSSNSKPHTVKEAKLRKRLRDNLKAKRASTKVQQSSKFDPSSKSTEVNNSEIIEDKQVQCTSKSEKKEDGRKEVPVESKM